MRNVQVLDTVYPDLAGRFGPPVAIPSSRDFAWGGLSSPQGGPALRYVFDPAPEFVRAGAGTVGPDAIRDRASGTYWSTTAGKSLALTTEINGQPTLTLEGGTGVVPNSASPFSNNELTMFAVFRAAASTLSILIGPREAAEITPTRGSIQVQISTAGNLQVFWGNPDDTYVQDAAGGYSGAPVLAVVSLSASRGVTIRRNGVERVRAGGRSTPLLGSSFNLFSGAGVGSRFSGGAGIVGVADVDLTRPEYASALQMIESDLMQQYGIGP